MQTGEREGVEEGATKVSRKQFQANGLVMFAVNEVLQRARLDQGIDLDTVAARTRIKIKYLQAIEANDPKSLPGGFFYKSFAHQYATFLGVDTHAIDAEIDRALGADVPPPIPMATTESAVELLPRSRSTRKYFQYAAFVLILVACSGVDDWWHENRAVATERRASRAPVAVSLSPVAAGPSAVAPVAAAPSRQGDAAAPAGSKVELALTATEETWLSVSSDGTQVFSGLLEANQTKTIEGKQSAKLRVGNAAGLEVRLNGKSLGPLGAHGQVRDLVFTSDQPQSVSPPKESQ
jgi:cytoskeletal protein RodZ